MGEDAIFFETPAGLRAWLEEQEVTQDCTDIVLDLLVANVRRHHA